MVYTLTALYPFLLLILFLVILQRPAVVSIPIILLSTAMGAHLIWEMNSLYFLVAGVKSLFVTLDILYIVAGIVFLFLILQKAGIFENFEQLMTRISTDRRIQAIIVSWLFVGLLEGTAGFGTPGMLAAGILVHIGFRPMLAVILPLIGGFVATTFGAVGVPISIGIEQGIAQYANPELIQNVTSMTALFHLILGSGIPLLLSCITTYQSSGSFRQGLGIWKFALFSGIAFTLPMYLIAIIFGPEFPSIAGALIAFCVVLAVLKKKLLLPKSPYRFPQDTNKKIRPLSENTFKSFFKTLSPYLLLVLFLGIARLPFLPIGDILSTFVVNISSIFGTAINHSVTPLYSPGFFIILTALFSIIFFKVSVKDLGQISKDTIKRVTIPFIVLLSTLTLINILIYSNNNSSSLPNMLTFLSNQFLIKTALWPLLSPLIGMLGAFVSGSVTVSNLLFASLQYESAVLQQYSLVLTLTLQTVGSAAGNMIALHNIVAALSVVKLNNKESTVIRNTIIPALLYSLCAGVLSLIIVSILKLH